MADGSDSFLTSAQQGSFTIDQTSAEQMIESIEQMQDGVAAHLFAIGRLKVQAKLGELPEAQMIAALNVRVASATDQQSLEESLQRLLQELDEAHQGLQLAIRSYAEVDTQAEQGLGRIGQ